MRSAAISLAILLGLGGAVGCERSASPEAPAAEGRTASDTAAGQTIRGSIHLAPGVEAPAEGVIFVIARGPGSGPPLAVRRLELGTFPLAFELGPGDVMHPGASFAGPIFLGARVDLDGNAMTREPGELGGIAPRVLEPGAHGVALFLTRDGTRASSSGDMVSSAVATPASGSRGVAGVIRLADGVAAPRDSVLFVVARLSASGPPLAAKVLPAGPFPVNFEIGPSDIVAGTEHAFDGALTISARLDSDGDASTLPDSDPQASAAAPAGRASAIELILR